MNNAAAAHDLDTLAAMGEHNTDDAVAAFVAGAGMVRVADHGTADFVIGRLLAAFPSESIETIAVVHTTRNVDGLEIDVYGVALV